MFETLHGKLEPTDTIITFNWDTLLDDSLGRRDTVKNFGRIESNPPDNQYTNFFENLSSYSDFTYQGFDPAPYTEYSPQKGYFLKLHGSIDWAYCTSANCRFRNKVLHLPEFQKQNYCNACHAKLWRLIVLPLDSLTIINPSLVSGRSTKHWNRSFLKNILDPIGHKARDVEFYEYFSDFCQERPISIKHGLKAPYSTKR